jgi:hypothetical protein
MKSQRILVVLAVLWAFVGLPQFAPAAVRPAPATPGVEADDEGAAEGFSVVGQVTEINHESGEFVLTTAAGPVRLVAPPEDLKGIKIGDVLRLALVDDEAH